MYRFLLSPRWLAFHLLASAAIVLMVNLGFWQLRRLDERQALQRRGRAAASTCRPQPLDDVLVPAPIRTRSSGARSTAAGTYLPDEQLVVVNRSQSGLAGDIVVTPLQLDDGRILLVQRGFVPLGADRRAPPAGDGRRSSAACARRRSAARASSATRRPAT